MILRTPQRWTRVVVLVHAEIVPAHPCARYWCVSVDTLSLAPYTVLPRAARSVKARSTWCRFVRDPGVQAAGRAPISAKHQIIAVEHPVKSHLSSRRRLKIIVWPAGVVGICLLVAFEGRPESVSALYARGYAVIPEPQQVKLEREDFRIAADWRVERGPGVEAGSPAEKIVRAGLEARHVFKLAEGGGGPAIRLEIHSGSAPMGKAQDKDGEALARQAYRLKLTKDGITLTANAPAGLFYGAETLVQLVKRSGDDWWLPEGEIDDWPDVEYR